MFLTIGAFWIISPIIILLFICAFASVTRQMVGYSFKLRKKIKVESKVLGFLLTFCLIFVMAFIFPMSLLLGFLFVDMFFLS